jgi:hypothetical protein
VSGISFVVGKKETGQLQLKFILEIKNVPNRSPNSIPILARDFNFIYCQGIEVNIL